MAQYIEIASSDMRLVIQKALELGKLGAEMDKTCPAHKIGPMYAARVKIDDDSDVKYDNVVKKGKKLVDENDRTPVTTVKIEENKTYTRSELEEMTLAEVRKATGIKEGGKEAIINQYLPQE